MRDLAAASGMSLAGMYYYVKGKEELLFLVQERCFVRVLEEAGEAVGRSRDPLERLQAFIRHHGTYFAAHMGEMKVLSHEADALTGEARRRGNAIKRRHADLLGGVLREAAPLEGASERRAAGQHLYRRDDGPAGRGHPQGALRRRRACDHPTRARGEVLLGGREYRDAE